MLILMLVFALCVSAATTYKFSQSLNGLASYISNEIETLQFKDGILRIVPSNEKDKPIIIENEENLPIAFMEIEATRLEMLFVKNNERGKGLGKQLLKYGIENYNVNELTVNEQNPNAKRFYEYLGFKVYKRNERDEQGNPYPILYMRLER